MGFLFGGGQRPAEAPTRMPVSNDAAARAAQARQRRSVLGRSGRTSTVLTQPSSGAGTGTQSYQNSLLGQAG
jgi:hypothetical protein